MIMIVLPDNVIIKKTKINIKAPVFTRVKENKQISPIIMFKIRENIK